MPIFIYIYHVHWRLSSEYDHNFRAEYYNGDLKIREVTINNRVVARGKEAENLILRLHRFQGGVTQQRLTKLLSVWESANTQHP